MKKLKTIFGLLFALAMLTFVFSSCTNDKDDSNLKLYEHQTIAVDPGKIKPPTGG